MGEENLERRGSPFSVMGKTFSEKRSVMVCKEKVKIAGERGGKN